MTLDEHLKHRGKMLKNLPMSDVRQIFAFEKIVRNYLKMGGNLHNEQLKQTK